MMRPVSVIFAVLGLFGLLFCWWGLETSTGRRQFDEMAGMIPLFAGAIAVPLLLLAALLFYLSARRRE
ncbi:hypothetical protein ACQQ2Q_08480 [Agrobacterium sp. ES01]|uniref:hypothetical protein n=1 Tax=Agrobacterium sp. ES01 TaxID=3420714 RepID=UPI003D0EF244